MGRSTHGGLRVRGRGGFLTHHAYRSELFKNDLTPPSDISLLSNILAESCTPVISRDLTIAVPRDMSSGVIPEHLTSTIPYASPLSQHDNQGKQPVHTSSSSPPPVIRSSFPLISGQAADDPNSTHSMLVDNISISLQGDLSNNKIEHADGSLESSDEEMFEDNELDDIMTLVQYQSIVRKKSLIHKGTHDTLPFLKKGRVDTGGEGSLRPDSFWFFATISTL